MSDPADDLEEAQQHAADDTDDASGAGYGNHAVPDEADEKS